MSKVVFMKKVFVFDSHYRYPSKETVVNEHVLGIEMNQKKRLVDWQALRPLNHFGLFNAEISLSKRIYTVSSNLL